VKFLLHEHLGGALRRVQGLVGGLVQPQNGDRSTIQIGPVTDRVEKDSPALSIGDDADSTVVCVTIVLAAIPANEPGILEALQLLMKNLKLFQAPRDARD